MPKLKEERVEERKREIIAAAWTSFMEKGYEKTTMREIARRLNASTGVLYTHFRSKAEILEAMQGGILKNIERTYAEMSRFESVKEACAKFFSVEFKYPSERIARRNCRAMVGLLAEAMREESVRKLVNVTYRETVEKGARLIKKGVERGEINGEAPPEAVIALFQALEWGIWLQIALLDGLDVKTHTSDIVKVLMSHIWCDEAPK